MTKPKPSDCRFAYESLDVCLHSSVLESFCVVHCAFLFNGFVCFFVFVFLTLNQKWGLVNMAVSVAVYVCMHLYACLHAMNKKAVLFVYWYFRWFRFCFMGNMELASVCLHCLSVTGTYSHSPQCLKQNQPNNTTDRILVNRLYLNKWTFLPETCFLVFFLFFTLSTFCIGRASWNWNHGYEVIICLIL